MLTAVRARNQRDPTGGGIMTATTCISGIIRRANSVIAAIVSLSLAGGCTTFDGFPDRHEDVTAQLAQLDRYYADDVLTEFYDKRAGKTEAQRAWRDEVVLGRLRAIDLHYTAFVQKAIGSRITGNAAIDVAVLGLSAAGTLVPAAGSKAVLAAIAGGLVGTRGVIDKEVFYEQTLPVLLHTMDALRKTQLAKIRIGLLVGPDEYPLLAALADVEDYYQAGTFPAAITVISQAAASQCSAAESDLKRACEMSRNPLSGGASP
jgi:hypothetical protein